jgi:hypothetical protein
MLKSIAECWSSGSAQAISPHTLAEFRRGAAANGTATWATRIRGVADAGSRPSAKRTWRASVVHASSTARGSILTAEEVIPSPSEEESILVNYAVNLLVHGVNSVPGQQRAKGSRQVAVEQDAHERLCRWRDQRLLGELQDSDRMLAGDGWKFVQELVERMASFQVVDQ